MKNYVEKVYNNAVSYYGEKKVLGSFLIGLGNYGFLENEKPHIVTIIIPSFDDLCLGTQDALLQDAIDLRDFYKATVTHDNGMLEFLFCEHYYINPRYEKIFNKDFIEKRESISRFCPKIRMQKAKDSILNAFDECDSFEVYRLYNASVKYMAGADTYSCFHETDKDMIKKLWAIKAGKETFDFRMIMSEMNKLIAVANGNKNFDVDLAIRNGILDIMNCALYNESTDDAFENSLSDIERQAYDAIFHAIGVEGTVAVSHLVSATGISKGTYQKLLKKMSESNICIVESRGVKGTYIRRL